jgi:hypothetical protein
MPRQGAIQSSEVIDTFGNDTMTLVPVTAG